MTDLFSLRGRTALVTGAGRGVGEGIAHVLARQGAAVAINDLHEERARAAAAGVALAVAFDVTDPDAVRRGIATAEKELGPIDILVNNAGVPEASWAGQFAASTPEDWARYVALNIYGPMYSVQCVLPGMCNRGWGRIVQISSGQAARAIRLPTGGQSLYGASKAAADGFVRHLAVEVAREGVTVNAVAPGLMRGGATDDAPADVVEAFLETIPAGRLGEAEEIGAAVAWLASEAAGYTTGQVIHVNGGSYQGR